jgi:hypothetical protein
VLDREGHDVGPAGDERLLVGQADVLARLDGRHRGVGRDKLGNLGKANFEKPVNYFTESRVETRRLQAVASCKLAANVCCELQVTTRKG